MYIYGLDSIFCKIEKGIYFLITIHFHSVSVRTLSPGVRNLSEVGPTEGADFGQVLNHLKIGLKMGSEGGGCCLGVLGVLGALGGLGGGCR